MPLESNDFELLLAAVKLLNSDSKLETLASRTLNSVFSLIPNEMVAFDGFGIDSNYNGNLWYSPPETVPEWRIQLLADLLPQQPIYQNVILAKAQKTSRISQYISLEEFHHTVLYNEFYRHIGGDSQLATNLLVSPELHVACSLHRLKTDFTDRDLEVLDLFAPHLTLA